MNVYPQLVRGLTFNVLKAPEFDTLIESAANKYDFRLPQTVNPFWTYQLTYEYLKDYPLDLVIGLITTDYRVLLDFFLWAQGQNASFLFFDPDDNVVGPAMIGGVPNVPLAQLPNTVTDGAGAYYTAIQRTFGRLFYEDITDLNLTTDTEGVPLVVYANGVLQLLSHDYTVSTTPGLTVPGAAFMGQYLIWTPYPSPAGQALSEVAGGTLAATTYHVRATLVNLSGGESTPSNEQTLAVDVNNLLHVTSPLPIFPARASVTGWNIYVSTATGTETKQNSTPIAIGTNWTEPTSGLIAGAALPLIDTSATPASPVTAQFGFYFRVRFGSDSQDFEKFMNNLWCIGGDYSKNGSGILKLVTSRPVPL
jgi:hypothetical protein